MTEKKYLSSLHKDYVEMETEFIQDVKKCIWAKIIWIEFIKDREDEFWNIYPHIILDNWIKIRAFDSEWCVNALTIITNSIWL